MSTDVAGTSTITLEDGVRLESGAHLRPVTVAYEIYGRLNARRDNAVLVCHALSGGAHAAGWSPRATKPGWWDVMIGPGKAFDTRRYCVISSNVLGSCYGTTGPASVDPRTARPYGSRFPVVTIADIVAVQRALLERLGIGCLLAVAGGSMGGMQALQWAVSYPDRVRGVVAIATTARHSAQQIAFDEVARRAIVGDPAWDGGDYYGGRGPLDGLAVARMLGHITYLSDQGMTRKFGRRRWAPGGVASRSDAARLSLAGPTFEVERYLHHQGESFVRRFDANSLVCLTKAMDYFDLGEGRASLADAFAPSRARFLLLSFSSDWLYPPAQLEEVAEAIRRTRRAATRPRPLAASCPDDDVTYREITSDYGHDAFLLEHARQAPLIAAFLEGCRAKRGQALNRRFLHDLAPPAGSGLTSQVAAPGGDG
jgi:homoserine O-acetyltransferase